MELRLEVFYKGNALFGILIIAQKVGFCKRIEKKSKKD